MANLAINDCIFHEPYKHKIQFFHFAMDKGDYLEVDLGYP